MYELSITAGTPGAHRNASPPTAATIAPSVKARKSITVVRRRRASTFERRARAAASAAEARRAAGTLEGLEWAEPDRESDPEPDPGPDPEFGSGWADCCGTARPAAGEPCGAPCRAAACGACCGSGWAGGGSWALVCCRTGGMAKDRTSTESVTASGSALGSPSSAERARRSLAYRRSIPARPDSSRMAVLKRSVGRASFSSSCLRSHIGTK